ncbi:unnamed protein product [Clavelina lepadiformis]|uniref:C-type lectin domain-containing protein n=1 Tax=Clavelina lepadiformis TaxID=159417 RepID=A0ABP0H419_CLALP
MEGLYDMPEISRVTKEQKLLCNCRKSLSIDRSWLGLNDIDSEGNWLWVDDSVALRKNVLWMEDPRQPDSTGDEDCAEMIRKFEYRTNDNICSRQYPRLCEKRLLE